MTKTELFRIVWDTNPHQCMLTGKKIKEAKTWCFPHLLDHGMRKKYKFYPNNVALVYGIKEHNEVDRLCDGYADIIAQKIEQGVSSYDILLFLHKEKNLLQ